MPIRHAWLPSLSMPLLAYSAASDGPRETTFSNVDDPGPSPAKTWANGTPSAFVPDAREADSSASVSVVGSSGRAGTAPDWDSDRDGDETEKKGTAGNAACIGTGLLTYAIDGKTECAAVAPGDNEVVATPGAGLASGSAALASASASAAGLCGAAVSDGVSASGTDRQGDMAGTGTVEDVAALSTAVLDPILGRRLGDRGGTERLLGERARESASHARTGAAAAAAATTAGAGVSAGAVSIASTMANMSLTALGEGGAGCSAHGLGLELGLQLFGDKRSACGRSSEDGVAAAAEARGLSSEASGNVMDKAGGGGMIEKGRGTDVDAPSTGRLSTAGLAAAPTAALADAPLSISLGELISALTGAVGSEEVGDAGLRSPSQTVGEGVMWRGALTSETESGGLTRTSGIT
ncbi:hypothetical protein CAUPRSCDRAFT_12366, partial [Caulochytrium protostelioides]